MGNALKPVPGGKGGYVNPISDADKDENPLNNIRDPITGVKDRTWGETLFDPAGSRRFMGKSTPDSPDVIGAARTQGDENRNTALFVTNMNRPTEVSDDATRTWELRPGADPNNPQAGDWIVRTTNNPQQQQIINADRESRARLMQGMAGMSQQALNSLGQKFDTSQLPTQVRANLPGSMQELQADRQRLEDSIYKSQAGRLDQRFQQSTADLRTQLANQGLAEGSEAYNRAMHDQNLNRQDAYQAAMDSATERGAQFQERQMATLGSALQTQQGLRDSAIKEQEMLRTIPLQELNMLRSSASPSSAQFGQYAQMQPFQPANLVEALNQQYGNEVAASNASNANKTATASAIASIAIAI